MRDIEVLENGAWECWSAEGDGYMRYTWRYVGGVLEVMHDGKWSPSAAQQMTLEEAGRLGGGAAYRLRPYDDAMPVNMLSSDKLDRLEQLAGLMAAGLLTSSTEVSGKKLLGGNDVLGTCSELAARAARADERASRLADECGALKTELNEAYAKIGRQERELEKLRRKAR